MQAGGQTQAKHAVKDLAGIAGARKTPFPLSVAPMLATLIDKPFNDPRWVFEPKLDGYRTISLIQEGTVKLLSRRGLDNTAEYPHLVENLSRQTVSQMVLDGEIVALDEQGRPSFQKLQQRLKLIEEAKARQAESELPILYYVFDILYLDGYDLRNTVLHERKSILSRVVNPTNQLRLIEFFPEHGEIVYESALAHGFEGTVAKLLTSVYESGRRSRNWLKAKSVLSDDFVIGGFTQGTGSRARTFGALLLGRFDEENRLVYVGHVGTGFTDEMLADMLRRLDAIKTDEMPFTSTPPVNAPSTWVRPELLAEVRFTQWTESGYLRAPAFVRLREDKAPVEARGIDGNAVQADIARPEHPASSIVEQLGPGRDSLILEVEGHEIPVNHLDKELWPAEIGPRALTKRDLLVYLAHVSPYILPHVRDRPLTLSRYPDGIYGEHFFQKHWGDSLPGFVETVDLFSEHRDASLQYLLCNNLATLLWLGQIADIEVHTWFSRLSPWPDLAETGPDMSPDEITDLPDFLIFDIDPYIYSGKEARGAEPELNREAFKKTCEVALMLKEILEDLSLQAFIKTSGKTGLHIHVPIMRGPDFAEVRAATAAIARHLAARYPRDITVEWSVEKREGKVFIDHNQNSPGKTLSSIYSPRPAPDAPVSMALNWDELDRIYPTDFTILNAVERLAATGDIWSGILDAKADLRAALSRVGPLTGSG